ncbi:MAG: exopolysaccharide transport family protein [Methyloceanibacter sp.]
MTKSHEHRPDAEDIDLQTLGRALWRAKGWILGLAIGAGLATFIGLSMVRPLYTSEARILVQNDESAFTRPTSDQGRDLQQRALDEQAVQSQVQVLTSRDLAVGVIKALDLTNNPDFAKDAGTSALVRFLNRMGLARQSPKSEEENAANTFAEHLSVFPLAKSSVIAVEYTSGDTGLAANVANKLADVYIDWQRKAKLEQTKDATAWLSAQIDVLRAKVGEAEAAAEQFKAREGLFAGTNNVTLNAQQLSELNSQLILAKAQKSEAEARARLIKKMLADKSDIDATPEVLKSELIARLIDQRVQVQRQLAELSATLLPSHPRIKQLTAELADVRAQLRGEAVKIVKGLENEAEIASARETSLRNSLNDVKTQASGLSEAEIKLRALEREAKAQRDLLESYLARYRDASARHDMGAVPAEATIVSRAHASILPSFPKRGPISLLVALATALLALAYVLARELIGAPAGPRVTRLRDPREPATEAAATARGTQTAKVPPLKAETSLMRAVSETPAAQQTELPLATSARPSSASASASASEPKRPSVLPRRRADEAKGRPPSAKAQAAPSVPEPAKADVPAGAQSAAGFLERLRRGLSPSGSEPQSVATPPAEGWLRRMRGANPVDKGTGAVKAASTTPLPAGNMPVLRTNDLRHYLNQRLTAAAEAANDSVRNGNEVASKPDGDKVGPVLKSLDAVLNHILASGKGGAPRALLVAGASAKVDATAEAISIARALVARREQVVLVDLTRGPAAVSGPLGLPRSPGLTDLAAGRASFEDVVKIDGDTSLQVIAAGNPKLAAKGDENGRFGHVFEALTQAYESVVLHADREAVRKLSSALKFELPVVVAVLPAGATASSTNIDLTDFSALGCPVVVYEQSGKEPRSRLLGRVAAI